MALPRTPAWMRSVTGVFVILLVARQLFVFLDSGFETFRYRGQNAYPLKIRNSIDVVLEGMVFCFFTESSVFGLAVTAGGLLAFGVPTESAMGHAATLKYLVVVCMTAVPLAATLLYPILLPRGVSYGAWPVLQAMLVAQCYTRGLGAVVWPLTSSTPPIEGGGAPVWGASRLRRQLAKVRVRHLPMLCCAASLLSSLFDLQRYRHLPLWCCLLATFLGWAYLRYSRSGVESVEMFDFRELFYLSSLMHIAKRLLRRSARWAAAAEEGEEAGSGGIAPVLFAAPRTGGQVLLPGSTPEEAERRRAVALAALARRLQEQQQQQQQQHRQQSPSPGAEPSSEPQESGAV